MLLNSNGQRDVGKDANPQIATDGNGVWIVVWHSFEDLDGVAGTDSDIFVAISRDNGRTWTSPMVLNTNATSDTGSDELPTIATDGRGHWVVTWYSSNALDGTVGGDTDIHVARSSDNGETWSSPSLLNTNGTTDTGDDAWPQVATDGSGNWIAVWWSRENLEGKVGDDIDIFTASSMDNGATWTPPKPLNSNASIDSKTDSEPRLATDGSGNWIVVWRINRSTESGIDADTDIAIVTSSDYGSSWTDPSILNSYGHADTGNDSYPVVTTNWQGNWVVVWRTEENIGGTAGTDRDIAVATSTDNGLTWSQPALLNSNGTTDSGNDQIPQIVTDRAGNWIAVWWSDDDLDGDAGTDNDIFAALSRDSGRSWTRPMLLNSNGRSDAAGDYVPQLATDGHGNWVAVWVSEDPVGMDNDIFVTSFSIPIAKGASTE